jgi:two-component system OmpR family sensor kinase
VTFSLRTQLFLWFGLAVILIVFGVTFLTEQVTVLNQERAIDDALQKRAHMVAAIISSDITTDETSYYEVISELTKQELPFVPLLLRIVSPSGKVIIEFGKVSGTIADSLNYQLGLPDVSSGRFDSIIQQDMDSLRVYTTSVFDPRTRQTLAFVQTVESLAQVEESRRQLWQNGIVVGLVGSSLALAVGLFLIRRGFRPLQTILQTINEVDYNHLKTKLQKEARPAELEQLAKSLTAMWQRLDLAVAERQKLIGSVSHDIRTPLTALQGQLEVLLLQPSLSAETRDSIERMLKETRRLVRLLRNLLLNVQLESKPTLVTEEVNLRELADEVVGDMWTLTEGLQFNIVAPRDVDVYGDRDLFKQMLMNIVDNAIKFTSKGGKVELTLSGEGDWAVMEVSDTGRGIPSDDLPHVTEAFYRPAKPRRSALEGARLGLSIVKQIVELHGGHLEIQSQEGVGTSIRVRLPKRVLIVLPERK